MAAENPFARLFQKPTVRLAALEPGQADEPIKIRIITADPQNTLYKCVSYDRSQEFESEHVDVDGQPLPISKPLVEALHAFRDPQNTCNIWADLLIGRTDEERSTQAREMKAVFEHAAEVTAWLGPGSTQDDAAMDMIQTLANKWNQVQVEFNLPASMTRATLQQMGNAQAWMADRLDQFQPSNKPLWDAIYKIFCTGYFNTTQSIPEIVLAKKPVVKIGKSSVAFKDFAFASSAFLMLFPSLQLKVERDILDSFHRIQGIRTATRRKADGEHLELFPMMRDAQKTAYKDPREIVFSVLPISRACTRTVNHPMRPSLPAADYSKSAVEVLKQASKYVLEDRQDTLLWWCERPPCGHKMSGLPSWAIDLTSPYPNNGPNFSPDNGLRLWADPLDNKRIYVDNEDGLHLQAHALDRIESVSKIFTEENCRQLCLQEWQMLLPRPNESSEQRMDRFFRTLVLNIAGLGETFRTTAPPSAELRFSFQSLLAEERILQVAGCTMEELVAKPPEFVAEIRAKPEIRALRDAPGYGQQFDELLRKNTIGRRFFQCESGRYGMTAIETPPPREDGAAPIPNFDQAMGEPLMQGMMAGFQSFLAQRDPRMANILAQGMSGTLPGQQAPGVRIGDVVVAVIGGYQPYILRPVTEHRPYEGPSAGPSQSHGSKDFFKYGNLDAVREEQEKQLNDSTKYNFVGDCYLHGVMDGECFKETAENGTVRFKRNIRTVDITIV